MSEKAPVDNPKGKEGSKLEAYRTAIKDAQHVFNTYKDRYPAEAWDALHKILFQKF